MTKLIPTSPPKYTPPPPPGLEMLVDSGTNITAIAEKHSHLLTDKEAIEDPESLAVATANSQAPLMLPESKGTLTIGTAENNIKTEGTQFNTASESLISVSTLIDENEGSSVTFDSTKVRLLDADGQTLAEGQRLKEPGPLKGLWVMKAMAAFKAGRQAQQENAGSKYCMSTQRVYQHKIHLESAQAKMDFLSAIFCNPVQSTLIDNLDLISGILSHLGLTAKQAQENAAHSRHTPAGHMKRTPSNFHSTSKPLEPKLLTKHSDSPAKTDQQDSKKDQQPQMQKEEPNHEGEGMENGIFAYEVTSEEIKNEMRKQWGDFTGDIGTHSFDRNTAIMIFYDSETKFIKAIPIVQGTSPSEAYKEAFQFFADRGHKGNWFCADNALSKGVRTWLESNGVQVQLVPPYNHRANIAERIIQIFKDHFVSCLSGVDPTFPHKYWHMLIPQAELTLNMLRRSKTDPSKSAYEVVFKRQYDINKCPLMPPGISAMVHESRDTRPSYGVRASHGWYVSPAREHYRCYTFVMEGPSGRTKISDTAEWFPVDIILPGATPIEQLIEVLADLKTAIKRLPGVDKDTMTMKPKLAAIIDELNKTFHGDRHRCAGCDKPYDEQEWDDWTECRHPSCQDWYCCVCSGLTPPGPGITPEYEAARDLLAKHEKDVHGMDPEAARVSKTPTATPAVNSEGAQAPVKTQAVANPEGGQAEAEEQKKTEDAQNPEGALQEEEYTTVGPKKKVKAQKEQAATAPKNGKNAAKIVTYDMVKQRRKPSEKPPAKEPSRRRPPAHHDNTTYSKVFKATTPMHSQMPPTVLKLQPAQPTGLKPILPRHAKRTIQFARSSENQAEEIAAEIEELENEMAASVNCTIGPEINKNLIETNWGKAIEATHTAYGAKAVDPDGKLLTYRKGLNSPDKVKWQQACEKEINMMVETGNVTFVDEPPLGRRPMYYRQVLETDKTGKPRIRGTAGGDKSEWMFTKESITSRAANITAKKIMLNKVVSEGLNLATFDITNFFPNPLHKLAEGAEQYIRINHEQMTPELIEKYGQQKHKKRGHSYWKVTGSVYGLQEAGVNATNCLVSVLSTLGYFEEERSEKLMIFRSADPTNQTFFQLNTDDFAVGFADRKTVEELINGIQESGYALTINWAPTTYCGMHIEYVKEKYIHVSLPGYTMDLLEKTGLTDAPEQSNPLPAPIKTMGHQTAYAEEDTTPAMTPEQMETSRSFVGGALWAAVICRADIGHACPELISMLNNKPTQKTWNQVLHLAGYLKRHPNLGVTYYPSDMKLMVHTDANYKTPYAKSGGIHFLGRENDPDWVNGPIYTMSKIQPITTASVMESELIGFFMNGKAALPERQCLDAHGYPQTTTPFKGDNEACIAVASDTCLPKRSRYVDDKFFWVRDRVRRGDFSITWVSSEDNLADPFTKALSACIFKRLLEYLATESPSLRASNRLKQSKSQEKAATHRVD